jgi:hypothetical protein
MTVTQDELIKEIKQLKTQLSKVENANLTCKKELTTQLSKVKNANSIIEGCKEELGAHVSRLENTNKTFEQESLKQKENFLRIEKELATTRGNLSKNVNATCEMELADTKEKVNELMNLHAAQKHQLDQRCLENKNIIPTIIPYGNGAWLYDEVYAPHIPGDAIELKDGKVHVKPGLFKNTLTAWNKQAEGFPITQVFSYGGDIEMYCRGSGESQTSDPCIKANGFKSDKGLEDGFVVTFPGEDTDQHIGLKSLEAYLNIPKVTENIIILDGRIDLPEGVDYEYLNHINTLPENEAKYFADKVSKAVCGNDNVAGVQFDIEPFSFTGEGGSVKGVGQKYFYTQIAKNFAGWNGYSDDTQGINPEKSSDPLGCVNENHPNGRIFSIFTFAKYVTPDVKTMLTQHGNGYIMDSLYDLGPLPGGQLNSLDDFKKYAEQEIKDMKALGVPYQFAIPAAASAHEFESKAGNSMGVNQIDYVKAVMDLINPKVLKTEDPNFKGFGVWSYNQTMFWPKGGDEYTPASPPEEIMKYLDEYFIT